MEMNLEVITCGMQAAPGNVSRFPTEEPNLHTWPKRCLVNDIDTYTYVKKIMYVDALWDDEKMKYPVIYSFESKFSQGSTIFILLSFWH